ncbi:Concanavalin A-like lectin/glucanase subgroup [Penicillium argentinense]|uniref:Concanavalin A-like lectin/glucanase subgroup n=1 Tax=Penicillium argentinense TaxID=1131581 RepID=A0A9W9EVW7_9EURO|nr:Concanavalin A-like lectin/glucanase subgroup [Penicillium argentinense]KAJ5088957.1 Concanavalin A-like lectin/glucanase subgroup [Penicillium argentinense]
MERCSVKPIIPGFAPDPSICCIEGTFFLVNSSFHLFPGLPIYSSRDLITWKHIGNAINRPSQLSLKRAGTWITTWDDGTAMVATGGLYAPTIRHHRGVTYIICTNVIHDSAMPGDEHSEQFIICAQDIFADKWSDPVVFPFPGIDPSLLFDDEKVYVQLCKTGVTFEIFNMEIDITRGQVLAGPSLIWKGWSRSYTEGPHVYKKDGWYYLLCAEGGTFQCHMLTMARSRSIWGPFEAYDRNPLSTANGTNHYIQHTGHGDFFQDGQENWWVVMLGVRKKYGRSIMGRESFLTSVVWDDDGWPSIMPILGDNQKIKSKFDQSRSSRAAWVYLRDPRLEDYHMYSDGQITLRASPVGLTSSEGAISFVGQRQRELKGTSTVTLINIGDPIPMNAGLVLYKDEYRFWGISYNFRNRQVVFEGINRASSYEMKQPVPVSLEKALNFKISYNEDHVRFFFKNSQGPWQFVQAVDTAVMTNFDFTGPIIGIFAEGDHGEANFKNFIIDAPDD